MRSYGIFSTVVENSTNCFHLVSTKYNYCFVKRLFFLFGLDDSFSCRYCLLHLNVYKHIQLTFSVFFFFFKENAIKLGQTVFRQF